MLGRVVSHPQKAPAPEDLRVKVAMVVAVCVGLHGCSGDDWQAKTHPAQGRVIVNGQPAGGAVVELHSTGDIKPDVRNSRPWAVVQDDGTFTLSTYEFGDGAPLGEYAVVVRWPPNVNQPSLADRLNGAYSRPDRSKWRVTISEGENELPPLEITGAKVLPKEQAGAKSRRPPGPAMGGK